MNTSHQENYILIVDDQIVSQRFLEKILTKNSYQVMTALNAKIALDIIKDNLPDLILLDIMMPDMNGYELCAHLKNNQTTKNIPIIFLTCLEGIEDKIKAFEIGGVDYIIKPYQQQEVIVRIETHLKIKRLQEQLEHQNNLLQIANEKLKKLCVRDELTQIINRRGFEQTFKQEWYRMAREKQQLSLIICDIDYFKLYNDKYGHQQGDKCLKKVAQTINNCARRPADLVARYGGEEFVVILPNTPSEGAIHVAEFIQIKISQLEIPHEASKISQYVTLSLGISSMIPHLNYRPENLLKSADQALYEAKDQGRNRLIFKVIS